MFREKYKRWKDTESYKEKAITVVSPIIIYWVQARKDKRISSEWVNVKGFDTYKRAKELLDILNE